MGVGGWGEEGLGSFKWVAVMEWINLLSVYFIFFYFPIFSGELACIEQLFDILPFQICGKPGV